MKSYDIESRVKIEALLGVMSKYKNGIPGSPANSKYAIRVLLKISTLEVKVTSRAMCIPYDTEHTAGADPNDHMGGGG